jgi:hypothetical protein
MTFDKTLRKLGTALTATAALCVAPLASAQVPAAEAPAPVKITVPLPAAPYTVPEVTADLVGGLPLRFHGEFWVDTGYLNRENTQPGLPSQENEYMTGRFVLGTTYARKVGNLTAAARVELLGLVNEFADGKYGEPHVQDVYLQLGNATWDVMVGRLLAQEVYYRGQGIELYSAEEAGAAGGALLYLVDFNRGQKNGPGQAAFHLRPNDWLSFELAGTYGFESEQNNLGIRPVVDFHSGGFQAVASWEYLSQTPVKTGDEVETISQGYGGRVQYRLPFLTVGLDAAQAQVDATDINGEVDAAKTFDKTSLGGWLDLNLGLHSLGLGYHQTFQKDEKDVENTHHQAFVTYLYQLPIDGLSVKAVYGYALAHIDDPAASSPYENALNSFRVRLAYAFK